MLKSTYVLYHTIERSTHSVPTKYILPQKTDLPLPTITSLREQPICVNNNPTKNQDTDNNSNYPEMIGGVHYLHNTKINFKELGKKEEGDKE